MSETSTETEPLILRGVVEYEAYDTEVDWTVTIGGVDALAEVDRRFRYNSEVIVSFGPNTFDGCLDIDLGSATWSEWTIGSPPSFQVGPHNLLRELERYDGQEVLFVVSTEPVDLGALN